MQHVQIMTAINRDVPCRRKRVKRVFKIVCTAAVCLLTSATWAAKKPSTEWRPPKIPDAVREKAAEPVMTVAPIDRSTRSEVKKAAAQIDAILQDYWKENDAKLGEKANDHEFVRRAYLELAGRIPTIDESKAFLGSTASDKRADLIDDLLESPGYVSHFYNFWADILRLRERPDREIWFEPYMAWVKQSIADCTPYDEWVYAMLTANGRMSENPAAGFQLRDIGMPLAYIDNTTRVFLCTQIGCAQCHDHPFDRWTQQEFYKLAGLTSGIRYDAKQVFFGGMDLEGAGNPFQKPDELIPNVNEIRYYVNEAIDNKKLGGGARNFLGMSTKMMSNFDDEFRLPHDYRYDDAEALDVVEPHVLWGKIPAQAEQSDNRTRFATWMTSQNRQFARAIANRMWKKVMGVGLVEPVDDFQEGNIPSHPELLEHLTDEMLRLDFDLREFVRLLVSTDVYQRLAVIYDPTSEEAYWITGPALKRMSAEQLWDSLLTLIAANEWVYQRPTREDLALGLSIDISTLNFDQFCDAYKNYQEIEKTFRKKRQATKLGGEDIFLVRASELPQPSPANHLMQHFGQGDRLAIQTATSSATVPQILTLYNGWMTHSMLAEGSVIYDTVAKQKNIKDAVDTIFLAILTHTPDKEMRKLAEQEIKAADNPAAGCGDLIWSLLNTREFMFIE